MEPKTIFIIGVNGVGKSTLLKHLKPLFPEATFEMHDFDERGVPDNADKGWRISETIHWIRLGEENKRSGLYTLIFGFVKPYEIIVNSENRASLVILLLDAGKTTIESRIRSRYQAEGSIAELERTTGKSVEKFTMDNIYVSSLLRKDCEALGCEIINTDNRNPDDIAQEVSRIILER